MLLILFSNIALGCLYLIDPDRPRLFFWLAFILRFIQGLGDSVVISGSYSIIIMNYPDQCEKYLGSLEGCMGFG